MNNTLQKPTQAFIISAWVALAIGAIAYLAGLWNAHIEWSLKGYFFALLMLGLYGAISLQKNVRDRLEGIRVTAMYYILSWVATLLAIALLIIGLWYVSLLPSEKGFYLISFTLSIFSVTVIQKNTRDLASFSN